MQVALDRPVLPSAAAGCCHAVGAFDRCACRVRTDDQVRLGALPEERVSHIPGFGHCCVQGILVWLKLGLVKVLCKGTACGQVVVSKCINCTSSEDWDQVCAHLGCTVGRRPICIRSSLRLGDAEAKTRFLLASLEAYSRIM